MTILSLAINLDDPFVAQEVADAIAATLRQDGYTVQPAQVLPDAPQAMGGPVFEIGQQILDNKDFYIAGFTAITAIAKVLHARHQARIKVQQEEREVTLTDDDVQNAALLRALILSDAPVAVSITDQES
jgi:hypothetical protein